MRQGVSFLGFATLLLSLGAVLCATPSARADDLKLKDGSVVSGTIVGYEANSFKVKTSYGYAVVEKDQVVSIGISSSTKTPAEKNPEAAGDKTPPSEKSKTDSGNSPLPPLPAMAKGNADLVAKPAQAATAAKVAATTPTAPLAPAPTAAAPATAANPAPPKPPEPEPIREAVNGNIYTNETYRFHMYKPPDWDVIATAPAVLPGAITAMGTGDDSTYLLIGQEPAGKSLSTDMDTTERRLRDVMQDFRPLGEKQITVSGAAATEHRFRGSVDKHEWSGVVVLVPRGGKLYTIFGMTRADNDLVQIQENVIARAISSLQFTEQ